MVSSETGVRVQHPPAAQASKRLPFEELTPKKKLIGSRYEIHEDSKLGHGSFGSVMKATDHWTKDQVAVKVVNCSKLSPTGRDLIVGETKMLRYLSRVQAKVSCPEIVKILGVINQGTMCYSFFELIQGKRLLDIMDEYPTGMGQARARKVFRDLCMGLQVLHNHGICHLDIKLENVMIDEKTDNAKLLDFGFSQFCFGPDGKEVLIEKWCGTIPYISPEIMRHDPFSGFKADIYNMGVLLYALIFHQFPYAGKTVDHIYPKAIAMECDAENWCMDPRASPSLVDLLAHLLDPESDTRYTIGQVMNHPWITEDISAGNPEQKKFLSEW